MTLAKSYCDDVEFSPMDATRADLEFTAEVCAVAVAEGATVINIPDTVGYTTPEEYRRYFERLYELVPELREGARSVHCHDDLGLAVANSYAGVLAGARQVECAVNGIGERAGNCSLEEIVVLLRTRRDVHGVDTGVEHAGAGPDQPHDLPLHRLSGAAEQGGRRPQRVRSRVGHPSGRGAEGADDVREWISAAEVGAEPEQIVLGKHSGRHALREALEKLGFKVEGNALNQAFSRFKEIADKKKQVTALDLEAIASDQVRESAQRYELAWFEVEAGSRREPRAKVAVTRPIGHRGRRRGRGRRPG